MSSKEIVIVLGPGRSGTSLVMQALNSFGVNTSEKLVPANASNPLGFFEDEKVVEFHKALLEEVSVTPYMPIPDSWYKSIGFNKAVTKLTSIIEEYFLVSDKTFAIKDPRIATFLPLWNHVFNKLKIVPKFILAVRRPESIVESYLMQYRNQQKVAELIILLRTVDAVHYTGGNYHLVNYDDWFVDKEGTSDELHNYLYGSSEKKRATLNVDPGLKRATGEEIIITNPLLKELFSKLLDNLGEGAEVYECVRKIRGILSSFSPWTEFSEIQKRQNKKRQNDVERLQKKINEFEKNSMNLEKVGVLQHEVEAALVTLEKLF